MSIETTLARGAARERERQLREHNRDCAVCGAKGNRERRRKLCRVGMALRLAADTARARARAEAEQDTAPAAGQLPLFDGAEWR